MDCPEPDHVHEGGVCYGKSRPASRTCVHGNSWGHWAYDELFNDEWWCTPN